MDIFDRMKKGSHEQLIFCFNRPTGLKAIIAIHDTTLGTSVGGTRLMQYATEEDAIVDALRLSETMTLESASLESDMGGGKAVLISHGDDEPDEAYFRAFGRFVEGLKGRFVTYPAFGTSDREFRYVRRETASVIPMEGNHELTAFGVISGMKACIRELSGHKSLGGVHVAVQGVPCAIGRILNDDTIPRLRCRIVAGAASDTLEKPRHAELLKERGILFAPDFVIGGAELFQTEPELKGAPPERLREEARRVYDVMADIITEAKKEETTPYAIAVARAARRVGRIGMVRNIMC